MLGLVTVNSVRSEADLFAHGGGTVELSPRAAFQAALHGRVSILDLRTRDERSREGDLPAYLSRGTSTGHREVVALVGGDGLTLGLPVIDGGFAAWRAAGMPCGEDLPVG